MTPRQLNTEWSVTNGPGECDFTIESWSWITFPMFKLLDSTVKTEGATYSVQTTPHVMDWLQNNFVSGQDYWVVRSLKGIWIDMTEDTFIVLKLKWS